MTRQKIALITNATDFAGPPGTDALARADFRIVAHDEVFLKRDAREAFLADHPNVELVASAEPEDVIEEAWDLCGHVDVIVSNDHYPAQHLPIEQTDIDDLRSTLERLVVWPYRLIKAAVPRFKTQESGRIVMITSCRTKLPVLGGAIPDAARDAANALVRSLSIELAPFGIPVNAVAPNYLYSEAYYPRASYVDDSRGREYVEAVVPAKRLGQPSEMGEVICFLATNQAEFLTGAIIDFAGGWPVAQPRPSA